MSSVVRSGSFEPEGSIIAVVKLPYRNEIKSQNLQKIATKQHKYKTESFELETNDIWNFLITDVL